MKGLLSLDRGIGAPLGNAAIVDAAAFNLFLAHIQGWGVKSSDEKALQSVKVRLLSFYNFHNYVSLRYS